jgi:hypothetical protein
MEAVRSSEMYVNYYQIAQHYIPEDRILRSHRRENLKFYIRVALRSEVSPSSLCTKIVYAFISSPMPTGYPMLYHLWVDHLKNVRWRVKIWHPSSCSSFQPSITSFLKVLQHPVLEYVCSYLMRDQVSHTYKETGRIMVAYTLFLIFKLIGTTR